MTLALSCFLYVEMSLFYFPDLIFLMLCTINVNKTGLRGQKVFLLTLVRSWTASKADLNGVLLASWKPQTSTCSQTFNLDYHQSISKQFIRLISLCYLLPLTTKSRCFVLSTCFRNLCPMPLFKWAPSISPGRSATEIYPKPKRKHVCFWRHYQNDKSTDMHFHTCL